MLKLHSCEDLSFLFEFEIRFMQYDCTLIDVVLWKKIRIIIRTKHFDAIMVEENIFCIKLLLAIKLNCNGRKPFFVFETTLCEQI